MAEVKESSTEIVFRFGEAGKIMDPTRKMIDEVSGEAIVIQLDAEGYLEKPADWNEVVYKALCKLHRVGFSEDIFQKIKGFHSSLHSGRFYKAVVKEIPLNKLNVSLEKLEKIAGLPKGFISLYGHATETLKEKIVFNLPGEEIIDSARNEIDEVLDGVKVVKLDKDGYLKNPEDWSEEVYRELLVLNGVQLNSKEHINEIKLIRQGYIFKGYTGRAVFRYVFRFCNCIEPANRLITQFKGLANLEIAAGLPKDTLKMS